AAATAAHGATGAVVGTTNTQTLTGKTLTDPVIANLAPGADFTLTQNSVVPFTSVNTGAVANTLYLKTGNVGIGTTGPGSKLEVAGAAYASNLLNLTPLAGSSATFGLNVSHRLFGGSSNGAFDFVQTSQGSSFNVMTFAHGNVGIGETAPGSKLSVSGGGTFGASYDTTAAPTNGLIIEGNVGIGTTSPGATLDVRGDVLTPTGSYLSPYGGIGRYENLLTYAEAFDNAAWVKSASTTTPATNITAPNGTATAESITFADTTSTASRHPGRHLRHRRPDDHLAALQCLPHLCRGCHRDGRLHP
ncbi:MAG: hypothetical protein FD129_2878, partial [bacterium]